MMTSNYSRKNNDSSGSCILIRNILETKMVNYLKAISQEKSSELSAIELLDLKTNTIYIDHQIKSKMNSYTN
jgi:hypothetical protein